MGPILHTIPPIVSVMYTHARLVVAKMISSFCIPSSAVEQWAFIPNWADSCSFIIFFTVNIRRVVELPVPPEQGPPPLLVLEVPVKTCEGSVLLTLVLQEQGALLHSELLQVLFHDILWLFHV